MRKPESLVLRILKFQLGLFLPAVLVFLIFSYGVLKMSLSNGVRTFFKEANQEYFQELLDFERELRELEKVAQKGFNKLKKSLRKPVKYTSWPDSEVKKFISNLRKNMKSYSRYCKTRNLLRLKKFYKKMCGSSFYLNEETLSLTYYDHLSALKAMKQRFLFGTGIETDLTVEIQLGKEQGLSLPVRGIASLMAIRQRPDRRVDLYLLKAFETILQTEFSPWSFSFSRVDLFGRQFLTCISGIPIHPSNTNEFQNERAKEVYGNEELFQGILVISLDLGKLFQTRAKGQSSGSSFDVLNRADLEKRLGNQMYLIDALEPFSNEKKIQVSEFLESVQGQGTGLRLREPGSEDPRFYSIQQCRYDKSLYLLRETRQSQILAPVYQFLLKLAGFVFFLCVSVFLTGAYNLTRLTSPIRSLGEALRQAETSLDGSVFQRDYPFLEIETLSHAFKDRINGLKMKFDLLDELGDLQTKLLSARGRDEILSLAGSRLERLFEVDPELIEKILEPNFVEKDIGNEGYSFIKVTQMSLNRIENEEEIRKGILREKELGFAAKLQEELMEQADNYEGESLSKTYIPARFVGGDFLMSRESDLYHHLIIADVSGKGLPAALFGACAQASLEALLSDDREPGEVLVLCNDYLTGLERKGFFCTVFYARYSKKSQVMEYASAGHNEMILLDKGNLELLNARGLPLGLVAGFPYGTKVQSVKKEMVLCLYTDGVTEAENRDLELYGRERLEAILTENLESTVEELNQKIIRSIHRFSHGAVQSDDITYLLMSFDC